MQSSTIAPLLWRTLGLAALAGARTLAAPALLSRQLQQHPSRRLSRTRLATLQSPRTAKVLTLLAAGEMIGDKLPGVPARISPIALAGRGLSGALVGATLFASQRDNPWRGAAVGSLSALAGAYATYHLRKQLTESTLVPDPIWGNRRYLCSKSRASPFIVASLERPRPNRQGRYSKKLGLSSFVAIR